MKNKIIYFRIWKLDQNENEHIAFEYCDVVLSSQYDGDIAAMAMDAYDWQNAKIEDLT